MDQSSSSDLQFSKDNIEYPIAKYPELDRLSTEILIGIKEGLSGSAHVKKTKEMFFADKRSGFMTKPEKYYRDYFGLDYVAHHFLREDGKINLDFLIGVIPKEGEWVGEPLGEGEVETEGWEAYGESAEEWIEKREREGYYDDDCEDECDDDCEDECDDDCDDECDDEKDEDCDEDYDNKEKDYDDDDDNDVIEKNRNLILMGKQFLVKFIEGEKIEADLKKASVQKAQWAIYYYIDNGGVLVDSILFFVRSMFMNSKRSMKKRLKILEANKHEETQLWKISDDGEVSI